jgi:hypothetical protein
MLIEAGQQRLVRLDDMSHWSEVRSGHGRRRVRNALAEASRGARSLPEADLLRLLSHDETLPTPWATGRPRSRPTRTCGQRRSRSSP